MLPFECSKSHSIKWYLLFFLTIHLALRCVIECTYGPIARSLDHLAGWTSSNQAEIVAIYSITACLLNPFASFLGRLGLRRSLLLSTGSCFLVTALRCIPTTPDVLLIVADLTSALASVSFAMSEVLPSFLSYMWFAPKRRHLSTSLSATANELGFAAAFLLGPLIVPSGSDETEMFNKFYLFQYTQCAANAVVFLAAILFFPVQPDPSRQTPWKLSFSTKSQQLELSQECSSDIDKSTVLTNENVNDVFPTSGKRVFKLFASLYGRRDYMLMCLYAAFNLGILSTFAATANLKFRSYQTTQKEVGVMLTVYSLAAFPLSAVTGHFIGVYGYPKAYCLAYASLGMIAQVWMGACTFDWIPAGRGSAWIIAGLFIFSGAGIYGAAVELCIDSAPDVPLTIVQAQKGTNINAVAFVLTIVGVAFHERHDSVLYWLDYVFLPARLIVLIVAVLWRPDSVIARTQSGRKLDSVVGTAVSNDRMIITTSKSIISDKEKKNDELTPLINSHIYY